MEEAYIQIAQRFFPFAALYLGSLSEARAAVIESVAAALRKHPEEWEEAVFPQLLRICSTRAPERIIQHDFPDDPAICPLLPVLRLPAGSRKILGILAAELPPETAASVCGLTADELAQKLEKALRQLTFTQNGTPAQKGTIISAAKALPWTDTDTQALLDGLAAAQRNAAPAQRTAPEITRSGSKYRQAVPVPLWGIVLSVIGVLTLVTALLLQISARKKTPAPDPPSIVFSGEVGKLFSQDYMYIGKAQTLAVQNTVPDIQNPVFTYAKLKTDASPAVYEIRFADSLGTEYTVTSDAKSGAILAQSSRRAEQLPPAEDLLSAEQLRQAALTRLHLTNVLFMKEKLSEDGMYKLEVLNPAGELCCIQLEAKTAELVKYTLERLPDEEAAKTITESEAKKAALSAADISDAQQVIFTKAKPDGALYLIGFTHDDGTQYLAELDAETGECRNLDVRPPSSALTDAVGLLAARDAALQTAELTGDDEIIFTKAKLDRRSGAYVYELEFETPLAEYEAVVAADSGDLTRYRFWRK